MMPHISFDKANMDLRLLDQRLLPQKQEYVVCKTCGDVIEAIRNMTVRGAPAIGVAAAYACLLALNEARNSPDWREKLLASLEGLARARPTAVNLQWAVNRMKRLMHDESARELFPHWLTEAVTIHEEDISVCERIGKHGAKLLNDGDTILTHCNAGALATGGYGTALGVIRAAVEDGKKISVIADETRPLLQGARLTAWELVEEGIPIKIAPDGASGEIFRNNLVQAVVVGADRVAANGDTANKIGTLNLALAANYFKVPFYVACPLSTIDPEMASGEEIPIEERSPDEIRQLRGVQIAPENAGFINYAFDVTPHELITGIITEEGVLKQPYDQAIARVLKVRNIDA